MNPRTLFCSLAVSLLGAATGCATSNQGPQVVSSSSHPSYVSQYPEALQRSTTRIADRQREARTLIGGFSRYPSELKKADSKVVLPLVERADEVGRSSAYVDKAREAEGIQTFFDDDRDVITRRVAGSAQYVVKQKGYDVDVTGAVSHSLKDSVDKQLEKRLRTRNDAVLLLDRQKLALGKDNAQTLERQADEIARASYLVNIDLVEKRNALGRLLSEKDSVRRTMENYVNEERAYAAEPGRTDAEKKASDERVAAMNRSRGAFDASVANGERAQASIGEQNTAIQKEYSNALTALKNAIREKNGK